MLENNHHNLTGPSSTSDPFVSPDNGLANKRKRRPAGTPDPDAEVVSLSPKTLLESDRYVCEICNQGFQRDQNLQMHRRRHKVPWKLLKRETPEVKKRVFVCPEPSCLHHDPCHALGDAKMHHHSTTTRRSPAPPPPPPHSTLTLLFTLFLSLNLTTAWRPYPQHQKNNITELIYNGYKKYEGSSEFVKLKYHMGPVLTENIAVHIIWYGTWPTSQKKIIREFINSISDSANRAPSVSGWWKTVQLYTDQTGSNITRTVKLGKEKNDRLMSHGKKLTRLSIQSVIKSAVTAKTKPLPIHPKGGLYLLLTADDVYVQDFCQNVCGFHYFTYPSIVGYTLPYAWIGNSAKLCPGVCAYPFAVPNYIPGLKPVKSPNGDVGIDGMISVIGHELAELASNPLVNAWYAGQDPSFPVEIADLCEGIYGTGGGGSYTGQMMNDQDGATYNMHGIRRRYLVQWVWNHVLNYCTGPNALD